MGWPTPQDYNEALQHPAVSFKDPELQRGIPELTAFGLPRPMTGAFASVYKLHCPQRDWAVRCFLHDIPDQHDRYLEVSKFVLTDDLVYTVDFEFIEQGILVNGKWYPILKMQWVDGKTLIRFIEDNLRNYAVLNCLSDGFETMVREMQMNGIAHGDLQHGNVLIVGNQFRLVDYDGMYVPGLVGWKSNELGHRNYQHPARTRSHFGPYLDNFSAWVIYLSLRCLAIDPDLWHQADAGDECLLFRQTDFTHPERSPILRLLEHHPSDEIRHGSHMFHSLLAASISKLPGIEVLGPGLSGRQYRGPSLFDRMLWAFKSIEYRLPWSQEPVPTPTQQRQSVAAENNSPLPSWLETWNVGSSSRSATGKVSANKGPAGSGAPTSENNSGTLPDWLISPDRGVSSPPPAILKSTPADEPVDAVKTPPEARKSCRQARELSGRHKYELAADKLINALTLISHINPKFEMEVLNQLASVYSEYSDHLLMELKFVHASEQYKKALHFLEEMTRLRGSESQAITLMTSNCLYGLSICYERDGKFREATATLDRYLAVLNLLPQSSDKIRRATARREDLSRQIKQP